MQSPLRLKTLLSLCCLLLIEISTASNNPAYEQRRLAYIDTALAAPNGAKIVLQAYKGLPLDTAALNAKLNNISTGVTSDFDIIELVRILYLSNGAYDAQILPVLNSVPYWINYGDTVRNYWTENHMVMWMGSEWLLHERYGKPVDNRLQARLRHYLRLKVHYGFYEFFSSVYAPYCLSGLLNLADFAQDAEIKSLATQASQRLLLELLMMTNDKGVYYPSAGRNYPGKYETPYGQNHNNLIYLLTGLGQAPRGASAGGPFLASSTLPVDTISNSWSPLVNTLLHIGHSLDSSFVINDSLTQTDRVAFQWTFGGYFHPAVVAETVQLLTDSNLWDQVDFALLRPLRPIITPQSAPALSESLSAISKSTVICEANMAIFKRHAVTLTSVQDFWKGKVGFQQHPCVANVGTTPVYLGSGKVEQDWEDRPANHANIHLPYVQQKKNIALLMYRPEYVATDLLGATYTYKDVALHWKDSDFDEVVNDSLWLLGRQGESYVAVRRSCLGEIDSVRACETIGGQSWVIMVGDSGMYGSFGDFQGIVHNSQFEERWYMDTTNSQYVYYARIDIDNSVLEYAWGRDTVLETGIDEANTAGIIHVFPNPVNDELQLNLSAIQGQNIALQVFGADGKEVYSEKMTATAGKYINAHSWADGIYLLIISTEQNRYTTKFIKR